MKIAIEFTEEVFLALEKLFGSHELQTNTIVFGDFNQYLLQSGLQLKSEKENLPCSFNFEQEKIEPTKLTITSATC